MTSTEARRFSVFKFCVGFKLRFGHLSLKKWLFYSCWTHQPLGRLPPRTITVYLQRPGVARVVHWPSRWTSSEQLTIWIVWDYHNGSWKRVRAFIELPWGIKNRTQYHGRAAQMADGHQTVNLTHKKLRGFESLPPHITNLRFKKARVIWNNRGKYLRRIYTEVWSIRWGSVRRGSLLENAVWVRLVFILGCSSVG